MNKLFVLIVQQIDKLHNAPLYKHILQYLFMQFTLISSLILQDGRDYF